MFDSSLHHSDKSEWKYEPGYSVEVAGLLKHIFNLLKHAHLVDEPFQRAIERIEQCLSLEMSERQRMVARWSLSNAYIGLWEWKRSSEILDDAYDLAENLDDQASCAEILYTNGRSCAADLNYESSGEYHDGTLSHLQNLSTSEQPFDPDFESHVYLNLAKSHITLGRHEEAKLDLTLAKSLLSLSPADATHDGERLQHAANIQWMDAVHEHWYGYLPLALDKAIRAYELYSRLPAPRYPTELATISGVIVETAIDLADTISSETSSRGRMTYLNIAHSFIQSANQEANTARDELTAGLSLLADARFMAAVGRLTEAERCIEVAGMTAREQKNLAIAVQADTMLGRIYTLRGEKDRARHCYQSAIDVARASSLHALAGVAQRALRLSEELG